MMAGEIKARAAEDKTVCIVQPYFFPYVGYFQLASVVDEFWILDCVQFVRRGWMNRNFLLVNGRKTRFSLPVRQRSRSERICDKMLDDGAVEMLERLSRTVRLSYARAPGRDTVIELLESLRSFIVARREVRFIEAAEFALRETFETLGIATPIYRTTALTLSPELRGQDRIIAGCQRIGATRYINPVGGIGLYETARFAECGIELRFIKPGFTPYRQGGAAEFVPGLSILDVIAGTFGSDPVDVLSHYELL